MFQVESFVGTCSQFQWRSSTWNVISLSLCPTPPQMLFDMNVSSIFCFYDTNLMRGHFRKVNEEEKHLSFENVDSSSPAPPPQIHAPLSSHAHCCSSTYSMCWICVFDISNFAPQFNKYSSSSPSNRHRLTTSERSSSSWNGKETEYDI